MENRYLKKTNMLNYDAESIKNLINEMGWRGLDEYERIGAIYDYVRNDILFGYNSSDLLTAEEVLRDGYGHCNTKATLLLSLFRATGIPCRLHGSKVSKEFQKGATSGIISLLAPETIIHTWVEVLYDGDWINLEGVITDDAYIEAVRKTYGNVSGPFSKYAISVPDLAKLSLDWCGKDTFVQHESMVKDYGVFDDPDTFFDIYHQTFGKIKNLAYVYYGRKKMIRNVNKMRSCISPS
ncbi:MAG: transglutaminase family protein [Eubacterium sp.]|nr:transglutaminase family protein [Eubacterium sp.]